jgi:hypothetical protein
MDMKKLIESMDRIEECGMTEMPAMAPPAPEMDRGNPVTMSVSLNASGKEHVDDLINMMKNAGMGAAEPVSAKMLSPRMDMERLSSIMGEPDMGPEMEELEDEIGEEEGPCPECGMEPCECDHAEEGYANEPDPQYGDMSDAIPNGNDLNRKKGAYKVVAGGDNPMEYTMEVESIKAALLKALTEKKAKPDFLDVDKDGNKKEPMKKAVKDAGKGTGSKPKKGQVPPQFAKKK